MVGEILELNKSKGINQNTYRHLNFYVSSKDYCITGCAKPISCAVGLC